MIDGGHRRMAGLRGVITERWVELLVLFLLALVFYLVSISVPLSSSEAADRISEKARQCAPGNNWVALKYEVASELEAHDRRAEIRELLLHLAVAFLVAIIIVVAFEVRSESEARARVEAFMRRLGERLATSDSEAKQLLANHMIELQAKQDAIAKNLYAGVFNRYLPTSITKEVENVLLEQFSKENCSYTLVFSAEHADELSAKQQFVLKRELRFRVRNFTLSTARFPIASRILNNNLETVAGKSFSGHRGLWEGTKDRFSELTQFPADQTHEDRQLYVNVPGEACSEEITLISDEVLNFGDEINQYTQKTAASDLRIIVRNELPLKIEVTRVQMLHTDEAIHEIAPGIYHYSRGVLPGQGVSVYRARTLSGLRAVLRRRLA